MITGAFLSVFLIMQIWLSFVVIRHRRAQRISLGDGGNDDLMTAMRQHGNFIETIPMGLLVLLIIEVSGFAPWVILSLGSLLLTGRCAHVYGLKNYKLKILGQGFRVWGMLLTFMTYILGALLCVLGALPISIPYLIPI